MPDVVRGARWRGLVLLLAAGLPALAAAGPLPSVAYVDPPKHGYGHEDLWVVEGAPALLVLTHSAFRTRSTVETTWGIDLRGARGLERSGDEVGLRLRPFVFEGRLALLAALGYRAHAGRELWKSFLELELFAAWMRGPEVGLRLGAGGLYELSRRSAIVVGVGAGGAVGEALVGLFDVRLALQLRF